MDATAVSPAARCPARGRRWRTVHARAYAAGSEKLPLFYTGCNGAFFGPRACALGSVAIGRHAFAGLAGPANVSASWVLVTNGTLRVTATGGVRVSAVGVAGVLAELCDPVDGTEVLVAWRMKRGKTPCPDSGPTRRIR